MGLHQRARFRAGAELQRDDALVAAARLCRGHGERLRIAQRLQEQEDDLDAVVLRHRGEIVGDGGDGFVACGDQVGETEVALVLAQDQCDGSALRDDAERAGLEHLHVPRRPHGDAIVHVDQAEIVGTADDDAVARGDLLDAALQVDARFVAVGIAVRIQKEGRDATTPRLFDQVGAARRRNRKEGRIHFFRQRRERRVAGEPVQRGMARVHRIDRARKADAAEIVEDARADRFRPFGDADDGDRSRIDQFVEGEAHAVHVKRGLAPRLE